ncbi:MAG TPA: hypothetical protein VN641_16205, partial [Urbifossiella sp.]|nr:hypothetical protein [Urbifossiella sp.]
MTIEGFKFDSTSAPLNAFSGGDSIQLLDNIFSNIQNHGIFLEAPHLVAANNLFTGGDYGGEDTIQ